VNLNMTAGQVKIWMLDLPPEPNPDLRI